MAIFEIKKQMSNNKKTFGQKLRKGLHLFKRAYQKTKNQLGVSLVILLLVTIVLVLAMLLAENTNDNFSFWDALVWPLVKYVEDPAGVSKPPITAAGKFIGTLVGVMAVAIFAVPAGLIGSGLIKAMEDQEHEQKLDKMRRRLHKSFRRAISTNLREYIDNYKKTHPDSEFPVPHHVVPAYRTVGRLQSRQGMDIKDISDICQKFGEFRMQDLSRIESDDEMYGASPNFVVETFPLNRNYGCCIDRNSDVTILSTSSWDEVGMGRFCYYMAKFGGFNYISKEIEADPDEADSFYNFRVEPLYNRKSKTDYAVYDKKSEEYKEAEVILKRKNDLRKQFWKDLKELTDRGQWLIIVLGSQKNSNNTFDIHLCDRGNLGGITVENQELYSSFCSRLTETMKEDDFGFSVKYPSMERYRFLVSRSEKNKSIKAMNIAYWVHGVHENLYEYTTNSETYRVHGVHEKNKSCDCFAIRPSSQLVNGSKSLMVAFRIALLISEMLDNGKGMKDADRKDLKTLGFGYKDFEDQEPGQKESGYNDSYQFIESIDKLVPPKDLDD